MAFHKGICNGKDIWEQLCTGARLPEEYVRLSVVYDICRIYLKHKMGFGLSGWRLLKMKKPTDDN